MEILEGSVEHHKDAQHIEKIKIGQPRQRYRPDKNIRLFFPVYLINPHQYQRKIDHRVGKVGMLHRGIDRPACKNIKKHAEQRRFFGIFVIKGVFAKGNPRQINPEKNQEFIEKFRIFRRHKHRQKRQRISDHIIVQCSQDIRSIADMHIPHWN